MDKIPNDQQRKLEKGINFFLNKIQLVWHSKLQNTLEFCISVHNFALQQNA
jgi:hypothetical protein